MARDLHQTSPQRDHDDEFVEPPQIRRFRRLVSTLMLVMIVGILSIAAALVWRLTQPESNRVAFDMSGQDIHTPAGYSPISISRSGTVLYILLREDESGDHILEERSTSTQQIIRRFKMTPDNSN